jgi:hypothetical protein
MTTTTGTATAPAPASTSTRARTATVLGGTVVANTALAAALAAAVDADDAFLPLQAGPVAVASLFGVLVGVALFAVLRRIGRQRLFVPIVAVGALLSLGGPLGLLGATPAEQPGVTDAAALALIPLHLLVGAGVLLALGRRTR